MSTALLRRGDRVGVVATGFAIREEDLDSGLAVIRRLGFLPVETAGLRARAGYLAGPDRSRAADLQALLDDPDIRGIWFARGGYGTARLLDRVDLGGPGSIGKTLIGYSDATALFAAVLGRNRMICLHAPLVAGLGRPASFHPPSLRAMLRGRGVSRRHGAAEILAPGRAAGRLMGGNLTVLTHLLGTPHMPDLTGAILFLEEIGEEAYRLDRLLNHLRMSGSLSKVKGVVVGQMLAPGTKRAFPPDREVGEVLRDHLLPLEVPVVTGFPAGHGDGAWTIPLGGEAALDTSRRRITLTPRAVRPPSRRG